MRNLCGSKYLFNVRQTSHSARHGRRNTLTLGKFFLSAVREVSVSVPGEVVRCPLDRGSVLDTDTDTDTSLGRQDHPRANLIGHQPIDPLTSQSPEHGLSFVFTARKGNDRFL
jgi:hypothetical protein